jgi:hypothetical protein
LVEFRLGAALAQFAALNLPLAGRARGRFRTVARIPKTGFSFWNVIAVFT